ncbi:putative membrane protein [Proteiniphilum saccharofermentans]|uniref:Putative membrane protein n=2 Tax=Proteiniphilum saccharofermentans TaxID=1642647 RepID=A0A1R3SZY8_9BACT|nr:putative membrane protein [Proteiniphilum saccharofermentans]
MKNTHVMEKTIKLLRGHYYGNIILLAVIFLFSIFSMIPLFADRQAISATLERYAIMITIIAIPASLKFFVDRLKKSACPVDIPTASNKYKNISFIRLYTISTVALMNIFLFNISRNMNFFWFTVVLFIVFLFCKPSYAELEGLTKLPEGQGLTEEEGLVVPKQKERESGEMEEQLLEEIQNNPEPIEYNYPENEQVDGK